MKNWKGTRLVSCAMLRDRNQCLWKPLDSTVVWSVDEFFLPHVVKGLGSNKIIRMQDQFLSCVHSCSFMHQEHWRDKQPIFETIVDREGTRDSGVAQEGVRMAITALVPLVTQIWQHTRDPTTRAGGAILLFLTASFSPLWPIGPKLWCAVKFGWPAAPGQW